METFLKKVARHVVANYSDRTDELCVVLPNRRAGLFLRTLIGQHAGKSLWCPYIYSSEDFVSRLSGLLIKDPLSQLFDLYKVYQKLEGEKAQPLDEFLSWGQVLLNDFNELDLYLADSKKLFNHLRDLKELDAWNVQSDKAGTFQKQYVKFFSSLGKYYDAYKDYLLQRNEAYQGLAYRIVADDIQDRLDKSDIEIVLFAGFNALTAAEEKMIKTLVEAKKAEVLWDADQYYLDNQLQEAGSFLRQYQKTDYYLQKENDEKTLKWTDNQLIEGEKEINIIGVPRNVGQAKVAGDILAKEGKLDDHYSHYAIVLADESLLLPVLHSLPKNIDQANITMGYPLRNTPVAGFFDLFFELHENAAKLHSPTTYEKHGYYFRDVLQLLNHPYFKSLLKTEKNQQNPAGQITKLISEHNHVFLTPVELLDIAREHASGNDALITRAFSPWNNDPVQAIEAFQFLIRELKDVFKKDHDGGGQLEEEFLFQFLKIVQRMEEVVADNPDIREIKTFRLIFNQLVSFSKLPFYGKPLQGLQIMGMLETRTLDFENIILLSASEGSLPATDKANSFIPYELKREYGLPVHTEKDAIYAYHFYRLLQRAKKVHLLYNTEADTLGSGEKSRFIRQLQKELPKVNPKAKITESLLALPPEKAASGNVINIEKTDEIIDRLKELAAVGFSPSALNMYINCPLQYYFHYVAKLREKEEVEEIIGAHTFGSVLHEVLETLYKPFVNKDIHPEDIRKMKKQVPDLTRRSFEKIYHSKELSFGKNLLTLRVAVKYLERFLDREENDLKSLERRGNSMFIKAVEADLENSLGFMVNGESITVKFRGKADRIDQLKKGITRIIDYKTGKAESRELNVKEMDEVISESKLNKGFQLLLYAYMHSREQETDGLQSGIFTFRDIGGGLKPVKYNRASNLDKQILGKFEDELRNLLTELFDPRVPFSQTDDHAICEWCSYKGVCNR